MASNSGAAVSAGLAVGGGGSVCTLEALLFRLGLALRPVVLVAILARPRAVAGHLLLELEDAVDQPLRGRRAAGDVDVHRDDLVDPLHHVVGPVEAARAGAGAHRDNPLG